MTNTRVLLVDDDSDERYLTRKSLENQNCDVVSAKNVTEALHQIDTQPFDVLVTDLKMPGAGDGFAVVTAMHHTQTDALNVVVSDFPGLRWMQSRNKPMRSWLNPSGSRTSLR